MDGYNIAKKTKLQQFISTLCSGRCLFVCLVKGERDNTHIAQNYYNKDSRMLCTYLEKPLLPNTQHIYLLSCFNVYI